MFDYPNSCSEKEGRESRVTVSEINRKRGLLRAIHLRNDSPITLDTATSPSNFAANSLLMKISNGGLYLQHGKDTFTHFRRKWIFLCLLCNKVNYICHNED